MTRRALITGAEGFVGKTLAAHLQRAKWQVVRAALSGLPGAIACDVTRPEQVRAAVKQAGAVTHVFHLAAVSFLPDATQDPVGAFRVNCEGVVHLIAAVREFAPEARLIYVGSADAYGPPQALPVTEEHPLRPNNPYGISKAAADHYCAYCARAFDLDIVRVRPFNHSGPGQDPRFVLPAFARQIAEIEAELAPPRVRVGNLDAKRDFLHVNDVARAYELIALRGETGAVYNVCSGKARSIAAALDGLCAQAAVPIAIAPDPARMRPVDVPEVYGSHDKLTRDTGWTPQTPFEQLLDDLLRHWRAATRA
ncbi:MAG TPA: GDP-mannose 4,6-dehydratase [Candidatus Hydrogenedentes bacterium]|nr:GDP-mannose 4,6-dehydratase [Candidatus Hydrogenedentota bacterium]